MCCRCVTSKKKSLGMFFTKRIPLKWGLTIFGVEIVSNNDIIDPRSPTAQKLAEEAKRGDISCSNCRRQTLDTPILNNL